MTASRTPRIEFVADPDQERRIRYAATLERKSVRAFVLDAAASRAEEIIASASATVVPSEFSDQLWNAFDEPPAPNPALQRRARSDRRIEQR